MTKIIIKMAQLGKAGKHLEDLIAMLEEPLESREFRMPITCEEFKPYGERVIETVASMRRAGPPGRLHLIITRASALRLTRSTATAGFCCA